MSLKEFYDKYKGQKNVGNTTANKGECVGLSSLWMDNFQVPHVYGHAKDLYANAPEEHFVKIPNTPDAIIQDGDIAVWSAGYNGTFGHTGVAYGKHDVNNFDCFQQNDPLGSTPHIKRYNYAYVIGWLRPKAYHGEETPKPPLEGLSQVVGYDPSFEGQDVMKDGVHYKAIKVDNKLVWKIEPPVVISPGYPPTFEGQDVSKDGIHYKAVKDSQGNLVWKIEEATATTNPVETPEVPVESQQSEEESATPPVPPVMPTEPVQTKPKFDLILWILNLLKKFGL